MIEVGQFRIDQMGKNKSNEVVINAEAVYGDVCFRPKEDFFFYSEFLFQNSKVGQGHCKCFGL